MSTPTMMTFAAAPPPEPCERGLGHWTCLPSRFPCAGKPAYSLFMFRFLALFSVPLAALTTWPNAATARESLGLYNSWGAFRDPLIPRCYAIAMAEPSAQQRDYQPFAAIGTWPRRGARSQIHFRLSRNIQARAPIILNIDSNRVTLTGGGGDAWPANDHDNAAIIATMRSATRMTVTTRDVRGRLFSNIWLLAGAASAMDAASIGCAKLR